ncbi:MAG: MOSC N-terminal beta barrel domain-containing protein [Burkholderiaceae bacterium]|nr:MOSC N-terminal beta barrel domain-containing protein [Burkholderiaceae bacterium]MDO9089036.1 MOSC N-terminal beta barrel domain-containing protein [Burkholderiaceae bacterium]
MRGCPALRLSEDSFVTDTHPDVSATISRIFVYPVKSCAGVELRESLLIETGLEFDRAWMVVDEHGQGVTQRELPRMALIKPQMRYSDVVLRAPGMLALHLAMDGVEAPVKVKVWGETVAAYDMGDLAAQWFSDFLGAKLRLARFDPAHKRVSSAQWTGPVEALNQFSDAFALLVTSEASLAPLNERLAAAGHPPVDMERFRPNIVLDGIPAHEEDRLDQMHIATAEGEIVLKPVKPCVRCPIPDVDPATAVVGHGVRDALQAYRGNPLMDGAPTFGMNAIVLQGVEQMLRVGQVVRADYRFED